MPRFRDTAGLIIDVRDNNGGDRDPLLMLYSYLAAANDPPRVFNAAAYRLYKDHPDNYLAQNHRMFRADAPEWTSEERKAVAEFAGRFKPKWELPRGQFSDWHYMALSSRNFPNVYHYEKPVIVLLNGKSFSATDVFLAGLKGMKNVVLMGSVSSGGSAFTQEIPLGETKLRLRIGSMASFQSDGSLFDGNGVYPDVVVEPVPDYFIGGRDNVLEAAVKRIRGVAGDGSILGDVPKQPDTKARYLFYLSGYIVEAGNTRPVSPKFGVYEYEQILKTFKDSGFVVISEARKKDPEIEPYARRVTDQVRQLLKAGVPAEHITVVGASQGAWIAMLASTYLENRKLNFVFIAACSADKGFLKAVNLHGNILSIYETSDLAQSCRDYRADATGINDWKELELNTGLKHGFLYRPIKEWIGPTIAWGKR
jgi:hypothetical protein